jgi:hypothetical protein
MTLLIALTCALDGVPPAVVAGVAAGVDEPDALAGLVAVLVGVFAFDPLVPTVTCITGVAQAPSSIASTRPKPSKASRFAARFRRGSSRCGRGSCGLSIIVTSVGVP